MHTDPTTQENVTSDNKQSKDSILSQFIKYASFNVIGMIGLSFYILADTFFIARAFGSNGLTALNLAIPVYSFISGFGLMIGMGGATRYSLTKGEKGSNIGDNIFTQITQLALIVGIIGIIIGVLFAPRLSSILGADQAVHQMTTTYLKTLLIFAPLFIMNNVLICFIRNDGSPNIAMKGMIWGSIGNIVLDYVFIFIFHMGIFGAALATGLSPAISMLILSSHFIKKKNQFRLTSTRLQLHRIIDVCSIGSPSFIGEVSAGIVMITFNGIILGLLGNVGVAAYGVIANLSLVAVAIFTGISQGIQPLLSTNYGNGNIKNVFKTYRYGIITSLLTAMFIYVLIYCFSTPIIQVFNNEENTQLSLIAKDGLRLYFTAFIFVGFNIISSTYFSALGKPLPAFVLSILRGLLVIIPVTFILAHTLKMTGVWLAFPMTEGITAIIGIVLMIQSFRASKNI